MIKKTEPQFRILFHSHTYYNRYTLFDLHEIKMAKYSTSEFKAGLKIMLDADPCAIIENEFIKPGKGQAFNRVKIRNLKTGRVIERTFKSGESVEGLLKVPMLSIWTFNISIVMVNSGILWSLIPLNNIRLMLML
jgi:hypothetical protein